MATPTQIAKQQLDPTYNAAISGIGGQMPAIQNLYQSLLSGLQQTGAGQVQNVVNSAAARGVSRAGLAGDATAALANTLLTAGSQLGVQKAQDISGLGVEQGRAGVAKANNVQQLAGTLQSQDIAAKENALKLKEMQAQAQLEMEKNQQSFNVDKIAIAKANARAAARASQEQDLTSISESALTRQLRKGLMGVAGSDKHVSPESLAKAYTIWKSAGLEPDKFWKNYQGLWNPKQANYDTEFYYFVNNPNKIK